MGSCEQALIRGFPNGETHLLILRKPKLIFVSLGLRGFERYLSRKVLEANPGN